jgi:transcriptional regulator with XRE-family HTH domain
MTNGFYFRGRIVSALVELMTQDEKAFFKALGARIAELRKSADMTQQQLADLLGISQQQVASYEVGRRRVPVSVLPAIARALAVSIEELIGEPARPGKRGPTPKLQQQIERLQQLPKPTQKVVMEMLDGLLAQAAR